MMKLISKPEEDVLGIEPVKVFDYHNLDVAALEAVDNLIDVLWSTEP